MKLNLRYFFTVAMLLLVFILHAQVQFSISLTAKEIGRKDEVEVDYVISGGDNTLNFQPPNFEGWQLITGPIITSQDITINKIKSTVTKYGYILAPKRTGKLKLPSTSVEVNNKVIHCAEASINVKKQDHVDGVPAPGNNSNLIFQGGATVDESRDETQYAKDYILKPGEDPMKKIRNNLFIKAVASKRKVYVGEPILVEYKLYTRLKSVSRVVKQPSFSGCSVLEMTTNDNTGVVEKMDGKKITSYTIRRVQLTPLQPGKLDVGPVTLDNDVTFITNSSDYRSLFYDEPVGNTQTVTLSSEPFSIEVLPLPKEAVNIPVGDFTISTKLKKDTSAANESNALIVSIIGSGNFKSVTEPEIKWSDNIYHFDAIETDEFDKLHFPLTGKKVFEIPFEVNTTGKIEIPAVTLRFFDPAKAKVQTITTDALRLMVTPAVKKSLQSTTVAESGGADINKLLYIIPIAFIIGAVILWRRSNKKLQPVVAATIAQVELSVPTEINLQQRYNDLLLVQGDVEFYTKAREFAKEMIATTKGDERILLQVLEDCNTMLYTPLPTTSKKEVLEKLKLAIN
jgi:hypothetical protein